MFLDELWPQVTRSCTVDRGKGPFMKDEEQALGLPFGLDVKRSYIVG